MTQLSTDEMVDLVASAIARVAGDFDEPWSYDGPDTPVMGDGGLSSLAIVAAILEVEQEVEERAGRPIELSSDALLSATRSPLSTVGTFAEFVARRAQETTE